MTVKIRLMGLPDEVDFIAEKLENVLRVTERSGAVRNRPPSEQVRVYMDAELMRPLGTSRKATR